jgi:hypothetical protein
VQVLFSSSTYALVAPQELELVPASAQAFPPSILPSGLRVPSRAAPSFLLARRRFGLQVLSPFVIFTIVPSARVLPFPSAVSSKFIRALVLSS